jgi:hypothetical protein
MTTHKLRSLVAEAVSLDRDITEKSARLAELKSLLKTEAETRSDEHTPTDAGGWSWVAEGADGCIARVTQEGGKIKSSISTDKDVEKAKTIAGPAFAQLFEPRVTYKLTKAFRDRAEQLLGKAAARLVKALSGTGQINVSFETTDK